MYPDPATDSNLMPHRMLTDAAPKSESQAPLRPAFQFLSWWVCDVTRIRPLVVEVWDKPGLGGMRHSRPFEFTFGWQLSAQTKLASPDLRTQQNSPSHNMTPSCFVSATHLVRGHGVYASLRKSQTVQLPYSPG